MLIKRKSLATGVVREVELDVSEEEMFAFKSGTLVQDAFPRLSADDREFIMSGITNDEWDELYPPEEE